MNIPTFRQFLLQEGYKLYKDAFFTNHADDSENAKKLFQVYDYLKHQNKLHNNHKQFNQFIYAPLSKLENALNEYILGEKYPPSIYTKLVADKMMPEIFDNWYVFYLPNVETAQFFSGDGLWCINKPKNYDGTHNPFSIRNYRKFKKYTKDVNCKIFAVLNNNKRVYFNSQQLQYGVSIMPSKFDFMIISVNQNTDDVTGWDLNNNYYDEKGLRNHTTIPVDRIRELSKTVKDIKLKTNE